jgi:hypothetical protein
MRFVGSPTLGLIWINFVHLFMASLLPFATAWIARTRLASSPVMFYAGVFVCIDVAYNVFEYQVLAGTGAAQVSPRLRRLARRRSLAVLGSFTTAMLAAFIAPGVEAGGIGSSAVPNEAHETLRVQSARNTKGFAIDSPPSVQRSSMWFSCLFLSRAVGASSAPFSQ